MPRWLLSLWSSSLVMIWICKISYRDSLWYNWTDEWMRKTKTADSGWSSTTEKVCFLPKLNCVILSLLQYFWRYPSKIWKSSMYYVVVRHFHTLVCLNAWLLVQQNKKVTLTCISLHEESTHACFFKKTERNLPKTKNKTHYRINKFMYFLSIQFV